MLQVDGSRRVELQVLHTLLQILTRQRLDVMVTSDYQEVTDHR